MRKGLYILLFLLLTLTLTSCGDKETKKDIIIPDEPEVTVVSVMLSNDAIYAFDYDNFLLREMSVIVTYSDETTKNVPVTRDMISSADLEKLFISGDHVITINYLDEPLPCLLILNATAGAQNRMGTVVLYSIATLQDSKVTYDFFVAGTGGFVSFDLSYENINELSELSFVKNEVLPGVLLADLDSETIRLTYSHGEAVPKNSSVFGFSYTGDVKDFAKNAKLTYSFYDYTDEVYLVRNVRVIYR